MRWFRIDKSATSPPTTGLYKDWKRLLGTEGRNQCVYCTISEANFGGERNFHVEHFKPKSRFKRLTNNFLNLFYACAICNTFKGSEWPGLPGPAFARVGFVDPSVDDYCLIFTIDKATGEISSPNIAGRYMVEQLNLNRPQLVLERRIRNSYTQLEVEQTRLMSLLAQDKVSPKMVKKAVSAYNNIVTLFRIAPMIVPYVAADARRKPKGSSA